MLRALSLVGGARMLSTAAQALTLLVTARILGPTDFAEFAGVIGGLMALSILSDGGATYAVGRHHGDLAMITRVFRASRLLSVGTLLLSLPTLTALACVTQSQTLLACLPLCAWVPLERQLEVTSAYLMSTGRQGVVGASYLIRRIPALVAVVALSSSPYVVWAFSATMLASAAAAVSFLGRRAPAGLSRHRPWLPDRQIWPTLRPFWAAVGGQGIRQFDVAILTFAAGAPTAGMFAPASRLVPALLLLPGTYTQLLLARIAASKEQVTAGGVATLGVITAAMFAPLALTAPLWIPLLLGEAYADSVRVTQIVIAGLVFAAMSSAFASGLHAGDCAARVAAVVWVSALSTLTLIGALGVLAGATGAAWATAGGYVLQFLLMGWAYHTRPLRHPEIPERKVAST